MVRDKCSNMEDIVGKVIIAFFLAFFVDLWSTLVGGGGAIIIPFLLFLGLSPQQAIATNRFAALAHVAALFKFHQQGQVKWRLGLLMAASATVGGAIGSFLLVTLSNEIIEKGIGVVLLLSLPMILLKFDVGLEERPRKMTKIRHLGGSLFVMVLGAIGGLFTGVGIWFSYMYLFYYGLTFLQTAAIMKVTGLGIILVSLAIFIPYGIIHWPIALAMFAGGGLGSYISAHYSKRLGNGAIRYLFIAVVLLSALKILFF